MPTFWNSWALWEKLVFCLGSAIATVIILGCLKLLWNRWRLRKYISIAATEAALKQDMQHSQSVRHGRAREVPFGVRALESGIEVEGVWISGTNTPASSAPGTPTLLQQTKSAHDEPVPGRASSASSISRLDMPQPIRGYPMVKIASESKSQNSSPFSDLKDSPESTHQLPPTSDPLPHRRPSYKPYRSSQLRYSNSTHTQEHETFAARDGHSLMPGRKGKRREGSESEYEEQDRSGSGGSASSNIEYHYASNQPTRSQRSSNEILHPTYPSYPRNHKPASYEISDISTFGKSAHEAQVDEQGYLVHNRQDGMTGAYDLGKDDSPKETENPAHKGRDPDDRVPVFHIVDDSTNHPMASHDGANEQSSHNESLVPFDANRQLRRPQVVRKINSGFRILAPGTLDAPIQSDRDTDGKEEGSGIKRQSHRLKKRSRVNSYSIEEP